MVSKGTTGSSSAGGGQYNSGAGNALTLVNTTVSGKRPPATAAPTAALAVWAVTQ